AQTTVIHNAVDGIKESSDSSNATVEDEEMKGKVLENSSIQSNLSGQSDPAPTPLGPNPAPAVFSKCLLTGMTSPCLAWILFAHGYQ
ncbi:hypothetical protein DNTS_002242, partial [Danionella cerebrum]